MSEHEPADPFDSPMSQGIFHAHGRTYTLGHVFAAAAFGGWAGGFWTVLEDSLCCAAYAADEGFDIDAAELQSAADQLRLDRNLVTAEETERWLAERDVDGDELAGYLERRSWHRRFSRQAAGLRESYRPTPDEMAEVLWPEVVFSGCLGQLAVPLARRVAAAGAASPALSLESAARAGCGPDGLAEWLARNRCSRTWYDELLDLEARYLRARDEALSPRRRAAALEARRLDLMRVRFAAARFPTAASAREACLCITADGEGFEPAVRRAGACAEERTLLLEDAPEPLRARLLSAAPGELILVAEPDAEPSIVQVVDKTLPGVDDPEVLARLEPGLVSQYFDPLVEADVRWTIPVELHP
jgi:hypothetical protein